MQAVPRLACPAWQDSRPVHRTGAVDYTGWDAAPSDTFYVSGPTARWGSALPGLLRSGSADSGHYKGVVQTVGIVMDVLFQFVHADSPFISSGVSKDGSN